MSNRINNNNPIDHAYKIYSLNIENSIKKVTMRGSHISEMSARMHYSTHNIIEMLIKGDNIQ